MARYSLYEGTFFCQGCNGEVDKARFWPESADLIWECTCGSVSKVSLAVRGY